MQGPVERVTSERRGAVLILASTVAFCLMSAMVRSASGIDPYKTTLFRFIVGLGILGAAAMFGRIELKFVNGPLLFLRGLLGGTAILLFFRSIARLGVGKATVLIFTELKGSGTFSRSGTPEGALGQVPPDALADAPRPQGCLTPLILNYIVGVLVFGELASVRSIVGTAMVVAACALVLVRTKNVTGVLRP